MTNLNMIIKNVKHLISTNPDSLKVNTMDLIIVKYQNILVKGKAAMNIYVINFTTMNLFQLFLLCKCQE